MHLLSQQITFIWCKDEWRTELKWFYWILSQVFFFFSPSVSLSRQSGCIHRVSVQVVATSNKEHSQGSTSSDFSSSCFFKLPHVFVYLTCLWMRVEVTLLVRPFVCHAVHVMLFHTTESTCSTAPPASSQQWESSGFDTNIPEEIHVWTKRDIPELLDSVFYNVCQKKKLKTFVTF